MLVLRFPHSIRDRSNIVTLRNSLLEILRAQAIECLDNPVVIHNQKLVLRNDEGHEKVKFLLTCYLLAIIDGSLSAHLSNVVSGLCSVVAICNEKFWDLFE